MNDGPIDSAPEGSWASACQNCGTRLTGPYCSHCGGRAISPRPTIRELAGDAWPKTVTKAISVAAFYGVLWGATPFGVARLAARG